MSLQTGRRLRLVAYLLEGVSMLGLVLTARQPVEPRRFAGLDQRQWTAGLALGLTLWIVGTVIFYWPRTKPSPPQD